MIILTLTSVPDNKPIQINMDFIMAWEFTTGRFGKVTTLYNERGIKVFLVRETPEIINYKLRHP